MRISIPKAILLLSSLLGILFSLTASAQNKTIGADETKQTQIEKAHHEVYILQRDFNADFLNLSDNFSYITIMKDVTPFPLTWVIFSSKKPKIKNQTMSFKNACIYFVYNDNTRQWYYESRCRGFYNSGTKRITLKTADLLIGE